MTSLITEIFVDEHVENNYCPLFLFLLSIQVVFHDIVTFQKFAIFSFVINLMLISNSSFAIFLLTPEKSETKDFPTFEHQSICENGDEGPKVQT